MNNKEMVCGVNKSVFNQVKVSLYFIRIQKKKDHTEVEQTLGMKKSKRRAIKHCKSTGD